MAHCFSVVDNFDGKFVKAIIELPFTGEFVTDGWLPNILVNKLRPAEEIAKTSISVCLANERSDNTCHQFSLFSSNAWLLSQATQASSQTNLQIFGMNSFDWKNAGENFIGESGLVFKYVYIPF